MTTDRAYLHNLLDTLPDGVVASIASAARGMMEAGAVQPTVPIAGPAGPSQADTSTAIFDAYIMVDWSASSSPSPVRPSADSIWYALVERGADGALVEHSPVNPRTRRQARAEIATLLAALVSRDLRVLVGCDFAYSYPAGTAGALGLTGPQPWRSVWNYLTQNIIDGPDNTNNRFEVAAEANRLMTGRACPFWGCPSAAVGPYLTPSSPTTGPGDAPPQFRLAETWASGASSVWQLYGRAGVVGSQVLVGIPVLAGWRDDPILAPRSVVWPFENGLQVLERPGPNEWRVLHAEIYPSLLRVDARDREIRDAAQVRTLARQFAELDTRGELAGRFAGPADLTDAERCTIETEEGWILDPRDVATPGNGWRTRRR